MRDSRIIIVVLVGLLAGCKQSVPTGSSSAYYEDLSHLRPEIANVDTTEIEVEAQPEVNTLVFQGDIREELDSINRMVIASNAERRLVDGYMIQIYTGNDREEAYQARNLANALDASFEPQITYHSPGFKVKVGPYFSKLEAYKIYESLKGQFPRALLIPERIEVDYD